MRIMTSKLAFRIAITLVLSLMGSLALFGSRYSAASSSTQPAKQASATKLVGEGNPYIKLQSRELQTNSAGVSAASVSSATRVSNMKPLALASGDLNDDGYPDLVCGYAGTSGGTLTVYRGDSHAFAPDDPEVIKGIAQGEFPDPFLKDTSVYELPEAPDFAGTGDFNRDGKIDMVVAARGGSTLYLLEGDGKGGFASPQTKTLPGSVTAMITGGINNRDGLVDVILGLDSPAGPSVMVFDGMSSILETAGVAYSLPAKPSVLALGRLDDDQYEDLAILANGQVLILHGHDNFHADDSHASRKAGQLETVQVPFNVAAFALGEFIWDRDSRVEIAMLADDGLVHIIARGELDTRPWTPDEILQKRLDLERIRNKAEKGRGKSGPAMPMKASSSVESLDWQMAEDLPAPVSDSLSMAAARSGDSSSQPLLLSTRLSTLPADDLLIMNRATGQLQVMYKETPKQGDGQLAAKSVERSSVSIETGDEVTAVLPMRVNVDGRPGIVTLSKGKGGPSLFMPMSGATFTVTRADDPAPNGCAIGDCSLREAVIAANADVGSDTINFNPGINPTLTITSGGGHEDAAATGDLDINSSVVIVGNSQTVISTNYTNTCGDCKVFGVNQVGAVSGLSVSFSGVTIQNGFNDGTNFSGSFFETGGGIDFFLTGVGNNHTMTNCVITNNKTQNGARSHGGGVNVDGTQTGTVGGPFGGTITFTGCSITNNSSTADGGGGMFLAADFHNVNLTNCTVTGNSTTGTVGVGGGVVIDHSFGGTLTIGGGGSVSNNTASTNGGGFAIIGNQVTNITGITVDNNTATGTGGSSLGGGILIDTLGASGVTGSTTLNTLTISNNNADNGASAAGGGVWAGGFYAVTMTGCTVSGNTSKDGAGVVNAGNKATPAETLAISGGSFTGNAATGTGGAFVSTGTGTASVTTFSNVMIGGTGAGQPNTAVNGGGIADTQTGSVTVTNNSIAGNSATTNGGGIFISGGSFTLDGVTVDSNTATTGDGLYQSGGTFTGANTINFNGGDSIFLAGGTFNSTPGTLNLTGNFTNSGGTFNHNNGTVIFNGTTAQSLGGTTSSAFNILTVNKTGTLTLVGAANESIANVAGGGNLSVSAGTFDLSTFTINRAAAGGTLTVSNGATLKIGGTNTLPSNFSTHSIGATSTIDYSGTSQTVATLNSAQKYGNLLTSGSGTKTLAGNISVATLLSIGAGTTLDASASNFNINDAGNWTNSGTFTPRSATVTFDGGSGTQTLTGNTTFFNLTLNNSGATTAFGATSTTIGNNLVTSAGTMDGGTSTITFTGATGSISGANTKNFNNLVINSGAVITNTTGGNTNISNDYTNNGTFTQAAGLTTTFNTGADGNHSFSGNGTTTFGVVTINISNTVDAGSHNFNVVGASFTVDGTFTGTTSTVTFNGGVAQSITGTGTKSFNGLTINNGNGVTVINNAPVVDASVSGILTLTTDLTIASGAILQQSGTSAGGADAIGTVRRTDLDATLRPFGNPNVAIAVNSGVAPNPMDVTLAKVVPPDFLTAVTRTYTLTPTGGSGFSATVKLHYLDTELNGNTDTKLALWKKIGATWTAQGRTGAVDTVNKAVTLNGVTSFSDWTLAAVEPVTITKAFGPASIPLNGITTLTLTLTNPNTTASLTGIGFADNFPAGLQVANPAGIGSTCTGTWNATPGDTTLNFGGGTLAPGASCTLTVNVTGTTAGPKSNTTNGVDSAESGTGLPSNTAILNVVGPPTIGKAFGAATIPLGGTTNLTFTITNSNASTALTGVGFTDTLPAGLTVATSAPTPTCGGTLTTTAPGTITLSGATVAAGGGTCIFSVPVTGATAGVQSNTTGAITSTEGGTGATSNTATITVVAPPSFAKSFNPTNIALNATSTLTFTITNPNTTVALTGVGFTDTLPAGLTVPNGSTSPCGGTLTITGNNLITLTGATIAASGTCTFDVTVTGTTAGPKTNTTAAVTSTNGGTGNAATAMITVATPPTISKAFGVSAVQLGGTTSLTFTITNPNASLGLTGISFTDTLLAGVTVASSAPTATCNGGSVTTTFPSTITFSGGTLAATDTCQFSVTVTGSTTGVWNNTTGPISSTESGTGATSNTATLTVIGPVQISKSFDAATIPVNGTSVLTFTVTNPNTTVALTGVAFTDTLPAGLTVPTAGPTTVCGGTLTTTAPDTITFSGGTLAMSSNCQITVTVTGATAGVKNNTSGNVTSNETAQGNTASASITVLSAPSIAKAFSPTNIPLNGTSTLTFTITNNNTTVALTGVGFSDTLPAGVTVPNSGPTTTCGGTLTVASNVITLSGASIAASGTCTFNVTVTGTTAGLKMNTTTAVTSTNGGTGNTASATLSVATPPMLTKAFGVSSVLLGGTTSLTFTISNPNTSVDLTTISFTDVLPAGITVASSGPTPACNGGSVTTTAPNTISFSGGSLLANGMCQFGVTVMGSMTGVWSNTSGAISSAESGAGAISNTAMLTVIGPPSISKAFDAATIPLGGTSVLTFTVTNPNTTTTLTGVAFTDTLPAGLTVPTAGPAAVCGGMLTTTAPDTITFTGGSIGSSGNCLITVTVTGATAGVKNNTSGTVSATNGGTGNTASASITVVAPPMISKAFSPTQIPVNGTSTLTFTITNPNSTVGLTGVGFSDTLPAGVTTPDSGPTTTCGGSVTVASNVITLTGASIAASGTCTFNVTVTGATAGVKMNTTSAVTSTNGGTGNTASATLSVAASPTINKAFGASSVLLGGTTSLTFTITNPNATLSLSGISFTDTLPAGVTVASSGPTPACNGGSVTTTSPSTISFSGGSLAAGAMCQFSVTVTGSTTGVWDNTTGAISSNESAPGTTSNTATLTVIAPPSISKAFGAATIPRGGTSVLTFTITNSNTTTTLTGVAFTDTLPAGLTVPNGSSTQCGGTVTTTAPNTISFSSGSIAPSSNCQIAVTVTGATAGVKNNTTGTVSATNGGTGGTSNTATITVVAPPVIAKIFGAANIPIGGTTTLTFTITNPNSTVGLTGVGFTDTLPAGLTVATSGPTVTCGGSLTTTNPSTITLTGASIAASGTCMFSVTVTGATSGTKNNTTNPVTSSNGGTGNMASATLVVDQPPVAKCKNVTVSAGANCTANASIDDGSFDPDPGDTITLSQSPPGPYPKGNTLVTLTVTDNHGVSSQCQATVTVVDTTPPVFTTACPGAINIAAQATCPFSNNAGVNYATPTASDNCPGVTVACVPPSGAMFPVGTTTVTCTATDTAGNTAVCTSPVTVFSLCVQDNSNPGNVVLVDTSTGAYRFCCNGVMVASGTGTRKVRACTVTISDSSNNRIVQISVDGSTMKGTAALKQGGNILCTISDNNLQNNTCVCQ